MGVNLQTIKLISKPGFRTRRPRIPNQDSWWTESEGTISRRHMPPPHNYNLRISSSAVAVQETEDIVQDTVIDMATGFRLEKFHGDDMVYQKV